MEKVIVFDLGGTLMRYEGMPHSWISYYQGAFEAVRDRYQLPLSESDILRSVDILREYNPRYKPREAEYSSEFLFGEAVRHWNASIPLPEIIDTFFEGIHLTARIYEDTFPAIARHFGMEAEGLIFVGDEKLDIGTARNAGCRSVLICRDGQAERFGEDARVENLYELLDALCVL